MKDDFYKDIQHKRSVVNRNDRPRRRTRKNKVDKEFSRSAKYNKEDVKATSKETNKEKAKKDSGFKTLIASSAASFKDKSSKYKNQFSKELGESKSKAKDFKKKHFSKDSFKKNRNKKPLIALIALLIPITLVLGVMIVSNFWPSGDGIDESVVVDDNEGQETREIDKDFENKKAELEKEFAKKDEEKNDDKDSAAKSEDSPKAAKYSEEQIASLEKLGQSEIDSKKEADEKRKKAEAEREKQRQEEEKRLAEERKKQEEREKEDEEDEVVGETHVVTEKDNLYRLAIRYYGDGSEENVQKIREANGISGNNLSVGQQLIIP